MLLFFFFFFFQAEDGIRDLTVTGVQTCALPISDGAGRARGAEAAERFLAAVEAGPVRRYEVALGLQPFQARGGFTDMLDGLLEQLREQARTGGEAGKVVEAIARVLEARDLAQGNVNPQLLAAVLADELGGEPA